MKLAAILCLLITLFSCSKKENSQGTDESLPFGFGANFYEQAREKEWAELSRWNSPSYITIAPYGNPLVKDVNVSASSELEDSQGAYPAINLLDKTWRSWAEASNGNGVGEYFTLTISEYNNRPIAGFALKNGYGNLNHYSSNNRVKSFRIYIDGNYSETIAIKDSISFEQYAFKEPAACKTIRFVIDAVYPGTTFNDTCIAEIALLDSIVDNAAFYENILIWLEGGIDIWRPYYRDHDQRITSVADADKLSLWSYLPFDFPYHGIESKIALLDGRSTLRLNDNLPRLDGATAMYPLYSSFVRAVYPEKPFSADVGLLDWGYFPNLTLIIDYYEGLPELEELEDFYSIVQCNTTSTAYQRLIDGETDIIFCYEPSDAEIRAAAERGKRFYLTPICKDAFVFIVNERNTVNNITLQQIRDIYSGRLTNWKAINGVDDPVIAFQRAENSGSQTTLQAIMRGEQLIRPMMEAEYVISGMSEMVRSIASKYYNYNSAIGYTFLFYLNNMAGSEGTKVLSINGIVPNSQNIQNGSYPFSQTVYAVTTGNESENTKKFIEWILSDQGRELIVKTGYTPL